MKKILIIDDDPDIRKVLTTVFEGKYEVQGAGSREEGTKALKGFLPDLVILDVMMEQHDSGFEMPREIKHNEQLKHAKTLMLTNIDKEMKMNFKKFIGGEDWLRVDDYVMKPIDSKQFLPKVEKLIGS